MRLSVRNDLGSRRSARFSSPRTAALATAEDGLQLAQTCQQHTRPHEAAQRNDREVSMVWPVRPEQTEGTRQCIADGNRCQPQSDLTTRCSVVVDEVRVRRARIHLLRGVLSRWRRMLPG